MLFLRSLSVHELSLIQNLILNPLNLLVKVVGFALLLHDFVLQLHDVIGGRWNCATSESTMVVSSSNSTST